MYKKLLSKIGYLSSTEGSSMLPVILPKDGLYFKPITLHKLKTDDIIIFTLKDKLVTHRVIFKTTKYIIAKGDNNPFSDGKIFAKQIIGRVYKIKRNGKIFNLGDLYLIQSTVYFGEIIKIKKTLEKQKIDFLFLKGLPLHIYYEKKHPQRIYADCDVLIKQKNFLKVEKIIKKLGYKKAEAKNKKVENNYVKKINGSPIFFDIHVEPAFLMTQFSVLEALYRPKLIDQLTRELFSNTRQITINGEKFFILDTEYLILYLSLHIFHHNFRGAFRYDFLNNVIRNSQKRINWQEIVKKIKQYQLKNFVYYAFVLTKKYYRTPIPIFFLKTIKPSTVTRLFLALHKTNIFDDLPKIRAGVMRFLLLFMLSPNDFVKRLTVFLNPVVWYFIFFVLGRKIISPRRQNVVRVD